MAREYKISHLATAPDTYYRQFEIQQIMKYLRDGKSVLDVGCGNGYSTLEFARKFIKAKFVGIDYSAEMVRYANQALQKSKKNVGARVKFEIGDVRKLSTEQGIKGKKFDLIVSERCLINLLDWDEQKKALLEMKKMLKKNGKIILTENTQEGLKRLNDLRETFDLPPIKIRWHNYYMPQRKLEQFARQNFKLTEVKNIGSLYYIISRVVYAKLAILDKKQPDYMHPINWIASQLPVVGDFSPNYIFVLERKK